MEQELFVRTFSIHVTTLYLIKQSLYLKVIKYIQHLPLAYCELHGCVSRCPVNIQYLILALSCSY